MKERLIRLAEFIIALTVCFVITYFGVFSSLDSLYQDKIYQIPRGMNQKIKIIASIINIIGILILFFVMLDIVPIIMQAKT